MRAQTKLLSAKIITHPRHKSHSLNHYNGFFEFERNSDPAEAAAVEPASSAVVVCCSGQRAESRENLSSPANKSDSL